MKKTLTQIAAEHGVDLTRIKPQDDVIDVLTGKRVVPDRARCCGTCKLCVEGPNGVFYCLWPDLSSTRLPFWIRRMTNQRGSNRRTETDGRDCECWEAKDD